MFDLIYRPRPHCRITALAVRADRRRRGVARFYEACGFEERPRRLVKSL